MRGDELAESHAARFNLPGLGRLMLVALNDRDYPLISGINLFFASAVIVANLITDLF